MNFKLHYIPAGILVLITGVLMITDYEFNLFVLIAMYFILGAFLYLTYPGDLKEVLKVFKTWVLGHDLKKEDKLSVLLLLFRWLIVVAVLSVILIGLGWPGK